MTGAVVKTRETFREHMTRFVLERNRSEAWFPYSGPASEIYFQQMLQRIFDRVADRIPPDELQSRSWKEAERNTLMLFKLIEHHDSLGSPQDILERISQNYTVQLRRLGMCPLWPYC